MPAIKNLETIAESIPNALGKYDEPFVIIYPRHPNRTALLAYLLHDAKSPIFYYALEHETTVEQFLHQLSNSAQFPVGFGGKVRDAINSTNNPNAWAEAFATDLAGLSKSHFVLVLDEIDRIQYSAAFQEFFLALTNYLPKQTQLLINGRELFRHPWNEIVNKGKGIVVGDDNALGGGLFTDNLNQGIIEFYSLTGDIRVLSDGYQVTTWDGALPRNLCYYFIEKERVTRDQIFQDFWPHLGIKEATNVFHVTKRKISEKLNYEITEYSSGFYVPSDEVQILYDAREFEKAYDEAMASTSYSSPVKWLRAVYLYRHPYLSGLDLDWVNAKREELSMKYVQALIELGRYHAQSNDQNSALGYYLRAVAENPVREDVHGNIMELYYQRGDKKSVQEQFKFLEKELKRRLNITPSKKTRALYENFING